MAMGESNAQSSMLNNFGERKIRGFGIKVAFYDVKVGSSLSQEVIGLSVGDVA